MESQILHAPTNQVKKCQVVVLTKDIASNKVDNVWWSDPKTYKEMAEKDHHWMWQEFAAETDQSSEYESIALLSENDSVEAAMVYKLTDKFINDELSGYVAFLATAPHNRKRVNDNILYKGCGSVLLYWAVRQSYNLGYGGKIRLESLKTEDTLEFYKKKGFRETGEILNKNLIGFELDQKPAEEWMKKQGDIK